MVVRGRTSRGVQGQVVWQGPDRFGGGQRVGIKTDAGDTVFVKAEYVDSLDPRPPAEEQAAQAPAPAPASGEPDGRGRELERLIAEAPDDVARYSVYVDWLQSTGYPGAERIARQLAAVDDAKLKRRLVAEQEKALKQRFPLLRKKEGSTVPRPFTWRWGFVQEMKLFNVHVPCLMELFAAPELRALTKLDGATTCWTLGDLRPLAQLLALRDLDLSYNPVTDLRPIAALAHLRRLRLAGAPLGELPPLRGLGGLKALELDGTRVKDVSALAGLVGLEELGLGKTNVHDVASFPALPALKKLSLRGTVVKDVAGLAAVPGLKVLSLAGTLVTRLEPLKALEALTALELNSTEVSDVAPLAGLEQLERLNLAVTRVADVRPLASLPRLKELYVARAPVPKEQLAQLEKARPGLKIDTRYTFL